MVYNENSKDIIYYKEIFAMTLVILAAGLGSRYGGLKQLDPMTDNGEVIIDFSIFRLF